MENDGCILIDSDDDHTSGQFHKGDSKDDMDEILDFVDSKNWYSMTIEDPLQHSREDILDGLLQSISPIELVPVLQENEPGPVKKIYATQCEKAVKKISSLGFQFCCKDDVLHPVRVKVIHNDPPKRIINPLKIIYDAIALRYTKSTYKLDISAFSQDFMFHGRVYFPLWYLGNQKLLTILLKALSLTSAIHVLDLSDNDLTNISNLNIPLAFPNLTSLNLANNKLKSMECLRSLQGKTPHLTTLNLDGNDLCLDFIGEHNYTACIKMIFPSLTTLDGRVLSASGLPTLRRNYTVDWDAISLVDRFMKIYFTLFDSDERDRLFTMYSPQSVFSITGNNVVSNTMVFRKCRNLLKNNPSAARNNLHSGVHSIISCISALPKTVHDPFTFHVDISMHSNLFTMFNIMGVLKIPAANVSEEEPIVEFTRTFIISSVGSTENCFKITNDMLHMTTATSSLSREAFKNISVNTTKLTLENIQPYLTEPVINGFIDVFMHVTEFPYLEARSCLERNKWNIRSAFKDAMSIVEQEKKVV